MNDLFSSLSRGAKGKKGIVYCDGGSRGNPGCAACAAILYDESGKKMAEKGLYLGHETNNVAEYQGLLEGFALALENGIFELWVRMDSKLVVEQMAGHWKVKEPNLKLLFGKAKELESSFHSVRYEYIPREKNTVADKKVNEVLDKKELK